MSIFVDTSVWFAAVVAKDQNNARAKSILESTQAHLTTDHVLVETWLLLNSRYRREAAERFWEQVRAGGVTIELVTPADMELAWTIGTVFHDQAFSIVDRTSFAVMERLGITQAASFDNDFAVYRFGRGRERAFEIVRDGHSSTFRIFYQAILERKQLAFVYKGTYREVCPHILGHKKGKETALVYQFAGESAGGLPPKGQWCCFSLSEITDVKMREGRWHSGGSHQKTQQCVDLVYVDVNVAVPNQPGRR